MASRITPARAGNRQNLPQPAWLVQDHPRACGEQAGISIYGMGDAGSPPRVRGTGTRTATWRPPWGITPARAGNSLIPHRSDL